MESFERLFITLVGSFGGFVLGLLAVKIKEFRDRTVRLRAMCTVVSLLTLQLKEVLHEDPKLNSWLKVDGVFQFLDLVDDARAPRLEFDELLKIYSQWSRGFFSAGAIRGGECNSMKTKLQRLANEAQAKYEASIRQRGNQVT